MTTHKAILKTNNFNEFLDTLTDANRKAIIVDRKSDLYTLLLNQYCLLRYLSGEHARAKNTWTHFRVGFEDVQSKVREWEEFATEIDNIQKKREQEFYSTVSKLNKDSDLLDFEHVAVRNANETKELNLCELLKNRQNDKFYHLYYGEVTVRNIGLSMLELSTADKQKVVTMSTRGVSPYTGELMLFPSKEQRDWSKYNPCEFADGELVWVKDVESNDWLAAYHTGHTKLSEHDGIYHECYTNQKKESKFTTMWKYCVKFEPRPF